MEPVIGLDPAPSRPKRIQRWSARESFRRFFPLLPALIPAVLILLIILTLISASLRTPFSWTFFSYDWNPSQGHYGILIFVIGSFLTAVPALFLAMGIGLGIAIASTVYLPRFAVAFLDPAVDLLAGIPSIVYGIWGYWVVAPVFGTLVNPFVATHFGFVPGLEYIHSPILSPSPVGVGLPIAIFVLVLMSLPITTLLIRDSLRSIPRDLWESGLALGATRWEVTRRIAIPYGSRGIWSAAFLGFGRAFGETVAVAMVIGAATKIPLNFYDTTNTMAAFMFENLDSAFTNPAELSALAELAILLVGIALVVNILGRRFVSSTFVDQPGI